MSNYYDFLREENHKEDEAKQAFLDQRFYSPRYILDPSLFGEGQKIPVVTRVNMNLFNNGSQISYHSSPLHVNQELKSNIMMPTFQVPIDDWVPQPQDKIFNHIRGNIIAPIHKFFGMSDDNAANNMIDFFSLSVKKCYNSDTRTKFDMNGNPVISIGFRDHCTNYMNYFEKYYDTEYQLLGLYAKIKYMIDCCTKVYTFEALLHDLWKYLINPNGSYTAQYLNFQLDKMNIEQYNLQLNYKNNKSPVLEYSDYHAKIMLKISVMQNMMIPLLTHYMAKAKTPPNKVKDILLKAFDLLFEINKQVYGVDLIAKIYETTSSNVIKNTNNNSILWDMQLIRARNATTHSIDTLENLIMQIIPKYNYNQNIIHFNYNAINREIKFKVTDVPYEYKFVVLSSSKRDEDNNSECDKFEAHSTKLNESIFIQTRVNKDSTMERIIRKYGPFDENEILFYYNELCRGSKSIVNPLQKTLVTYLFAKEFDDPQAAKIVDVKQYIILIIAAKRLLESYNMFQLPIIVGGKVTRIVTRKNINKKELQKIEASEYYPLIHKKYNNPKIEQDVILSLIAQILSSEFQIVDYAHPNRNGMTLNIIPDIVSEEVCRFVMLI